MPKKFSWKQIVLHLILIAFCVFCVLPFVLLVAASLTDEKEIYLNGYSFIPQVISFDAYQFLWSSSEKFIRAYGITILITVVGTVGNLLLTALLAYPMSRRDFPLKNALTFYVFFTMLFNGGLVPTYLLYTNIFDFKNTLISLIVPILLMKGFFVILTRTFFTMSIPMPVIESAYIDGASEFKIFWRIVLPLSLPVLATVGLFTSIDYWNDWFNGLIFITDSKLYSVQNMLNRMLLDIEFMKNNMDSLDNPIVKLPSSAMQMTVAVVGVVPIIIVYPFFQKYFAKGLTIGAVKG